MRFQPTIRNGVARVILGNSERRAADVDADASAAYWYGVALSWSDVADYRGEIGVAVAMDLDGSPDDRERWSLARANGEVRAMRVAADSRSADRKTTLTTVQRLTDDGHVAMVPGVSYWDVYQQQWRTVAVDSVSDEVLASLPADERALILAAR